MISVLVTGHRSLLQPRCNLVDPDLRARRVPVSAAGAGDADRTVYQVLACHDGQRALACRPLVKGE